MPKPGKTSAGVIPQPEDSDSKKFDDKESQAMIEKIRKEHSNAFNANKHKEYNPKIDQQRVWSERSDIAFRLPYKSLGKDSFLNHPQVKASKLKTSKKEK